MSSDRPLAVIDVDGVLVLENPGVQVAEHVVGVYGKWARTVRIPVGAAEILHELSGYFDVVWASAWSHNAHAALRTVLDLPETPWPFLPVQFHKLSAIREYAAGRPWVWIDDSIHDLGEVPELSDGILVPVDSSRGIVDIDPAILKQRSITARGRSVHDQ
jgi:hypothetical protein